MRKMCYTSSIGLVHVLFREKQRCEKLQAILQQWEKCQNLIAWKC